MSLPLAQWCGQILTAGNPHRLGAHATPNGVYFAVWAEQATQVDLCIFDPAQDCKEIARLAMPGLDDGIWHGFLPKAAAGLVYGYRVHGRFDAETGHLFDPNKVLLDPWARRIFRAPKWSPALHHSNGLDSAGWAALAAVTEALPPANEPRPRTPRGRTILFEAHAKGLTMLHPDVPKELRGTWKGLAHPAILAHLRELGITALELLPAQAHADDEFLTNKGLTNYWGYSTLGFFAPHPWASVPGQELLEFREMVKAFHGAGIEIILDVVYNHTCEGGPTGPHLSWRGFGPWYRRSPHDPVHYEDFTGCGNSLDMRRPIALRMVIESLRFWAVEMGVDGFRFDLASVLGRVSPDFDPDSAFFHILAKDLVLSKVKLIAEPWDASWEGYRLGHYPRGWGEWNDRFREASRCFWKNEPGMGAEFVRRMNGSDDIFPGKGPKASINYVTCHDGFTLRDVVSYSHKHNEANQEDNRDGADQNRSWNCGAEGETDVPAINSLRGRLTRSMLGSVLLSRGIPMILAGDELGNTQHGNNNAYCQDNALSWIDWRPESEYRQNLSFCRRLSRLRKAHLSVEFPIRPFTVDAAPGAPDGALALLLGEDLLGLFNPQGHEVRFRLPMAPHGCAWCFELSSADPEREADAQALHEGIAPAYSLVVLRGRRI
ncbi:MAG: glycogen debranching protein GlgX [Fibrobacterota bacterium]